MSFLKKHGWFFAILFVGIALRLGFIFHHGLSNDELSAWARLDVNSFSELWTNSVMLNDMHPALYQTFLYCWSGLFGEQDWILRLPAILFYIASSSLLYTLGRRYLSEWAGVFAVLGISLLTFPIIHTTFTRPYVTGLFFTVLLVYAIVTFIHSKKKHSIHLILIALSIAGAMYSHYFALVTVAVICFVSLFFIPKNKTLRFILSGIIGVGLFIPHIKITQYHLSRGGLQWLGAPENDWLIIFFEKYLNDSEFLVAFFSIIALLITFAFKQKMTKWSKLFLLLFLSVYVVGHLISVFYTPVLRYNVLLFSIPFLFLSFGHLFNRMKEHHRYLTVGIIFIGLSLHTVFVSQLYAPIHFPVFKELAIAAEEYNTENDVDDITYFGNFANRKYFDFYYTQSIPKVNFKMDSLSVLGDLTPMAEGFHDLVANSKTKQLGLIQSNMLMTPVHKEIVRQYYPSVVKFDSYLLSSFEIYEKKDGLRIIHSELKNNLETWTNQQDSTQEFIGNFAIAAKEIYEKTAFHKDAYVVFEVSGEIGANELLMVSCVVRDGDILQRSNGDNVHYQVQDMTQKIFKEDRYFLPFRIPEGLKDTDEIKMYIWNPKRDSIKIKKPKVYVVDPRK